MIEIDKLSVDDVLKELSRLKLLQGGNWFYNSGTGSGIGSLTGRILSITVIAPPDAACSFAIGSGMNITVPMGTTFSFQPQGLTTAAVTFNNTASWVVERVN